MHERYTTEEMARLWSERSRWDLVYEIWLAACRVMEDTGEVPEGTSAHIATAVGSVDEALIARAKEIEATRHHDLVSFLEAVVERAGETGRHLHKGLTSSDVLDTATGIQLHRAWEIIDQDLHELLLIIREMAITHKHTVCMGRSHGIHAEPTTFGLKVAGWWEELTRARTRLAAAHDEVAVGAVSGAVGTYAFVDFAVEEGVVKDVMLSGIAPVTTQVIGRDRHAAFVLALAMLATSMERITTEIRHLMRTEVGEVNEGFGPGQKGSSAMPHKRNPILSENLTGLARLVRAFVTPSLEDMVLWHERDMSHSSVERESLPTTTTLVHFMVRRLTTVLTNLVVNEGRMCQNLDLTNGVIYSQPLMLGLIRKGMAREEAYALVQRHATDVTVREVAEFRTLVEIDEEVTSRLTREELDAIFTPEVFLTRVDAIFRRLFPDA